MKFKDLFSRQSSDYAKYRPTYPPTLFDHLASLAPGKTLAWDCATGNGQAALELARRFDHVIGTDAAENQIAHAQPAPKVEYRIAAAESSGLASSSVDLITVAQAFHWFEQEAFFQEAHRVLKPQGILAFWCYGIARITPEVDAMVERLYDGILGTYWESGRRLVEEGYRPVRIPSSLFEELSAPRLEITAEWTLDHLLGYFGTWSSLNTYVKKNGTNPLEPMIPDFEKVWGNAASRQVRWELGIRLARRLK